LCLYLGWRKQWLALAAAVVTLIGLLLTTIPMFGPQVLTSYIQNFSSTTRSEFLYARIHNQGLTGVWLRVLNGVADTATIYWVYLLSAAIIVVLTITLCWPMRDLPTYWRFEYALILCALLMIPQYMWYHMLSLLFIPLVTVVEYLWRHQRWKLMALVLLLYLFTGVHGLVFHKEFAVSRWLTLFPFIFMFLLWSLLGWMIRVERRAERVNAGSREESLGAAYNLGSIVLVGNAGKSESSVVQ